MATKVQKNLRIDAGILDQFEKIANRKKQHHNIEIEEMMKAYIARDGQLLFDDLYAPRIEQATERAMEKQINRLAKMINKDHIDTTAALYSAPAFYNQTVKAIEDIFEGYLDPRLLSPTRSPISANYSLSENGKQAVRNLRNISMTDHKEQRKEKESSKEGMKA